MALRKLQTEHPTIETVQCDITARPNVLALVETIRDRYGMLDVLVKDAGIMERVDLLEEFVSDERIANEIAVNLTGPILLTRRLLPLLRSGRSPMIVMVTSGYALLPATRALDLLRDQGWSPLLYSGAAASVAWRGHPRRRGTATTGRYSCNANCQQSKDVAGGADRPGHAGHLAWQGRDNAGQGSLTADAYASGSVAHSTPCCRIMRHLDPRCPNNGTWRILPACRPRGVGNAAEAGGHRLLHDVPDCGPGASPARQDRPSGRRWPNPE